MARDEYGNLIPQQSILFMVDNVCPGESPHCDDQGRPPFCEEGAGSCNDLGMQVNVDLCDDSGAAQALLGGRGLAKGWISVTDCANWYAQGGQVKTDVGSG